MKRNRHTRLYRRCLAILFAAVFALSGCPIAASPVKAVGDITLTVPTAESSTVDSGGNVDISITAPSGYSTVQELINAGYTTLSVDYEVSSYTAESGANAGVQAYYAYGDNYTYITGSSWKNCSDAASGTTTLSLSGTAGTSGALKRFGLQVCNVTAATAKVTSAKLIYSGSTSSGSGSSSSSSEVTGESTDGLSATVTKLKGDSDWSEYNYTVTNATGADVSGVKLEIPYSGTVSNLQSWNCSATLKDGYILVKHTKAIANGVTYSCDSDTKFGFGGGATLGAPVVSVITAADSELKYSLTGETKTLAAEDTPVGKHGALQLKEVDGYTAPVICDEDGNPYQLRGASTHGLQWDGMYDYVNTGSFQSLRDEWGVNMVRLVNYVTQSGYTQGGQERLDTYTQKGVETAKELGMYAIVDWHIHQENPHDTISSAKEFFTKYATMYKDYDNVIFEICNEPTNVEWYNGSGADLYSYCKEIVKIIRDCGSNALIICGTNTWSQDVDEVAEKPLKDDGYENILYTFHFYSGSHYDNLKNKVRTATAAGTPIFVTEFGVCDASGNGGYDTANADDWIALCDSYNISYACWSLCNKNESASYLLPTCTKKEGGWLEADLSTTGLWLVNTYRAHEEAENADPDAPSIKLSQSKLSMKAGDSAALTATVKNLTDATVTWKSSDTAVAAVDDKGTVTAKAVGTAQITASAGTGDSAVTAKCTVTVEKADSTDTPGAPTCSSVTSNTVTLEAVEGVEYARKVGDTYEWQESNVFTGLSEYTAYTFAMRYAATDTQNASAAGAELTVVTCFTDSNQYVVDVSRLSESGYVQAHENTISYDKATNTLSLLKASKKYTLKGSQTALTVSCASGVTGELDGVQVKEITGEDDLTLTLHNTSDVSEGVSTTGTLTLENGSESGVGILNVTSAKEAAIQAETITVNSGQITAQGTDTAAAVAATSTVSLLGGNITANAKVTPIQAPKIVVDGGMVFSEADSVYSTDPVDQDGNKVVFVTITYQDGETTTSALVKKESAVMLPALAGQSGAKAEGWVADGTDTVLAPGTSVTAAKDCRYTAKYTVISGTVNVSVASGDALTEGYESDAGVVVTIANGTNVTIEELVLTLSNTQQFTLSQESISGLQAGASANVTIALKNGLGAGSYTTDLTAACSAKETAAVVQSVARKVNAKAGQEGGSGTETGGGTQDGSGSGTGSGTQSGSNTGTGSDAASGSGAAGSTAASTTNNSTSESASGTEEKNDTVQVPDADTDEETVIPALSTASVLLQKGKSYALTTNHEDVEITAVTYANSKSKKLVQVTNAGRIKAKKNGTAKLKVNYEYDGVDYTCTLTVRVQKNPVLVLSKNKTSLTLKRKAKCTFVNPANMLSAKGMKFKSSDRKVVSISKKGVVTANRKGTAKITVTIAGQKHIVNVKVK